MTSTPIRERFGQEVVPHQLSSMARGIASGIGDGRPAPFAGYVWYRPEGMFQQNLLHVEKASRPKAA